MSHATKTENFILKIEMLRMDRWDGAKGMFRSVRSEDDPSFLQHGFHGID